MKKLAVLPLSLLITGLLAGCASTSEPAVNPYPASTGERIEPASVAKFSNILAASKLQISTPNDKPGSKYELARDSNFTGVMNEHFYVDAGSQALVMNMEGYKLRNELRVHENFKTDKADTFYKLSAELMPINPRESVKDSPSKNDAMTFLQVHNKGTFDDGKHGVGYIPHPLLRLVYEADRKGIKDNYWAIIKNNNVNCSDASGNKQTADCKNAYIRLNLGEFEENVPTKFDIIVGDSKLVITRDGKEMVNHDITYWKDMLSYFKAGVYNQFENGKSEAHFYQLDYQIINK
ncbi:polysaccharide lyase family 7 protein [Shewanella gaetbuli]|uniref:Polysaccharide lyase family 7 protein n=1 Tax=Shewanella gaetbuli TaxID=220752 RepID=A0A9X2CLA9_9GAMM|nr:polysaccharide lyase family 7 protein [Shewanella gaetbuli]MCL1142534.1 polysaccharide lyase family 7 protein [Shewanella gaetbuli]